MMKLFKHTHFKYFLLILLSLKVGSFVVENTLFFSNVDIYCEFDVNDFENENDEQREFDENKKIYPSEIGFVEFLERNVTSRLHALIPLNYYTQYLEFSTPPPEFA